jgi:hypothetical protein
VEESGRRLSTTASTHAGGERGRSRATRARSYRTRLDTKRMRERSCRCTDALQGTVSSLWSSAEQGRCARPRRCSRRNPRAEAGSLLGERARTRGAAKGDPARQQAALGETRRLVRGSGERRSSSEGRRSLWAKPEPGRARPEQGTRAKRCGSGARRGFYRGRPAGARSLPGFCRGGRASGAELRSVEVHAEAPRAALQMCAGDA